MTEAAIAAVQEAVDQLNGRLDEHNRNAADLKALIAEQNAELEQVNARQAGFVPRRHFWLAVAALAGVILLALGVGWKFHDNDVKRRASDKAALVAENARKRDDLVRGCERSNDQRATLREVIEKAYGGSSLPPEAVPPQLAELLRQSQEAAQQRKAELLALPGVQPVNCAAAFPPPALGPADR